MNKKYRPPKCRWIGLIALGLLTAGTGSGLAAECPEDTPTRIWVRIHGMKTASGTVTASLYDGVPKNFLKKGRRVAKEREPASTDPVMVCMPAPGPGTYAVALYHDENANRKLDRNWIGMPKEGYGFSNDAKGRMGPPSHQAAAFTVTDDDTTIDVKMRY